MMFNLLYELTLWVLKKSPAFMETECSLPFPQEPAAGPYPEPHESNSHPISLRHIYILSCCLHIGLPGGLFPSDIRTEFCMHF
jgi:hypothetical protein